MLDSYKPSIDASLSYEEIGTESAKHLTENPEPESSRSISWILCDYKQLHIKPKVIQRLNINSISWVCFTSLEGGLRSGVLELSGDWAADPCSGKQAGSTFISFQYFKCKLP